jgi:polyhydroxybutyrate depolymerase
MRDLPHQKTVRRMVIGLLAVPLALTACNGTQSSGSPTTTAALTSAVAMSSGCGHGPAPRGTAGTTQNKTLTSGAIVGSYELTVPRSYRSGHPMPFILLFYGFGSDPSQFSALTGLPSQAAAHGYLVAVPHAQGNEWQFSGHGTDATFVNALVQDLGRSYCINQRRIFATGFSAGAAFTIFYTCAHQPQIAAMATVAVDFLLGCSRPISILAFHGTQDPLVPYQNGAIGLSLPGVKVRGTELNMGDWARLDHCQPVPKVKQSGSQVLRRQWSGCVDRTSVGLYSILGGGHAWPGADPRSAVGLTTQQINATNVIVSFFGRS